MQTMKQFEENKQHIIRKGLKALYRKGYNATGVKEIADAAGIPKGSFYNYFSSKEEFALEAMRFFTERELEAMQQILTDPDTPPLDRVRKLYRCKIEQLIDQGSFSFGCFLCNITLEMADVSEAIAREATHCFTREYEPLRICLREAQTGGALDPSRNSDLLSHLIRNSWLGALAIMKANKSAAPLEEFQLLLEEILA